MYYYFVLFFILIFACDSSNKVNVGNENIILKDILYKSVQERGKKVEIIEELKHCVCNFQYKHDTIYIEINNGNSYDYYFKYNTAITNNKIIFSKSMFVLDINNPDSVINYKISKLKFENNYLTIVNVDTLIEKNYMFKYWGTIYCPYISGEFKMGNENFDW